MTPRPTIQRAHDDPEERIALYPDRPLDEAIQKLLAVDPRKAGTEEAKPDGDGG
jgi:hypothetical protein